MDNKVIVEALLKEASQNPASNAVLHVWGMRMRARNKVELKTLTTVMKKQGFNYKRQDYVSLLRLLVKLGIAEEQLDSKGQLRGIKKIKATLQSIGIAACNKSDRIEPLRERNYFRQIVAKSEVIAPKIEVPGLTLQISINNKQISIPVPENLTKEEIVSLVNKFNLRSA